MTTEPHEEQVPHWVWRAVLAAAGAVIAVTLAAALLIAGGATDPPLAGPVVWADEALSWAVGVLAAGRDAWAAAPAPLPAPPAGFTLTVRARLPADADPLAAWGVWLAEPGGSRVVYAINAAGYWTIRRCLPEHVAAVALEDCPALRSEWRWLFHPRLRPPGDANTITLHREADGAIRLRVNGERLGATLVDVEGTWGVWARAGDGESLRVAWERAEVRAAG